MAPPTTATPSPPLLFVLLLLASVVLQAGAKEEEEELGATYFCASKKYKDNNKYNFGPFSVNLDLLQKKKMVSYVSALISDLKP